MGSQGLTLVSPAKVNLFLRVLERRSDGYHNLASLFQAIDLVDTLHICLADSDELTCTMPGVPTDGTNLVLKAANLFRRRTGLSFGVSVSLEKRIPIQAGLGGGSSNAATTLWALNELCGRPATIEDLILWSGEIGSDITFFLSQGTAYCTGRGEIFRPLAPLPSQKLWIAKPKEGLSTPLVFGKLDLQALPARDPEQVLASFLQGDAIYFNDLEPAAFLALPKLAVVKQQLEQRGFSQVLMTGSGTSFFCLGEAEPPAIPGVTLYPANFINRLSRAWYSQSNRLF